jgi:hypothetical protein
MSSMAGRVPAGDATHHRLDVTFGTSRRGDTPVPARLSRRMQKDRLDGSSEAEARAFEEAVFAPVGAMVMGRRMADLGIRPPTGWSSGQRAGTRRRTSS